MKSQELLEQARIALEYHDRPAARRLAQQAVHLDNRNQEAWRFLAELSRGSAQKAYQAQADLLQHISEFNANQGQPVNQPLPDMESISRKFKGRTKTPEPTQPIPVQKPTRIRLFSILTTLILIATALVSLLVWIGFSTPTVSATDHSSFRLEGDLPKPSLTPTETPVPTSTPSPTPTTTPEPTLTVIPQIIEPGLASSGAEYPLPETPPNISDDERWIDVDLTHQTTFAYEGSNLIRTFIVSTGTEFHPTVTGQYHIYVKYRYTDMAGPGYYLPDVPYTMYFYKGYSLHGTYWHNNFGHPMSHGCVNLSIPDAEWLFYWASIGTLVNVHY